MDPTEFHRRIVAVWKEIGLDEIAGRAKVSRPTAQRWLEGTNCPVPIARESVFTALDNLT